MASTMGIIVCELGRYPFIFLTITVIGCFLNILSVVHLVLLLLLITIRHNLLLRLVCPSFLLCSFLGSCLLSGTQFFLRVLLLQLLLLRKRWWLLLFLSSCQDPTSPFQNLSCLRSRPYDPL